METAPPGPSKHRQADSSTGPQAKTAKKRKLHPTVQTDFSQQYNDRFDGSRPTILFDLNGVLVQPRLFIEEKKRRPNRKGASQALCFPRPGLRHLASLCPYFRIGLYTSARLGSVAPRANELWHEISRETTVKDFVQFHQVPKRPGAPDVPGALFSVVLDRGYCRPDPHWARREGGARFDSVKPLAFHGFDPRRTIIIDDSPRKILPQELPNAIIVPEYATAADPERASEPHDAPLPVREPDGDEDPLDIPCRQPVLRVLAALLLHHVADVSGDIRPALDLVRRDLDQALHGGRLPAPLAHLRRTPAAPGCGELPLLFISPPAQAPYGAPREIVR